MAQHDHQLWVFQAGATNTSSSSVDFILQGQLGSVPMPATPIIRPLQCRVESQPWAVDVVDSSGSFTAELASTAGYYHILQRIVQSRRRVDGGAYTVIGSGRLTDVQMLPEIAAYRISIQDETAILRSAVIFNTSNTTHLFPSGPHNAYGPFRAAARINARTAVQAPTLLDGRWHFLVGFEATPVKVSQSGRSAIGNDLVSQPVQGGFNFTHLRATLNGTTFRVANFGYRLIQAAGLQLFHYTNDWLYGIDAHMTGEQPLRCWVIADSSNALALNTKYPQSYLHMMGAPPSPGAPLHIGGATGIHPMELKRQLFNGAHQSTAALRPRYSTAAFDDGTTGLLRRPMPAARWRITESAVMSEWIDDQLNHPCGVVDLLDSSGRLRPRSLWLPNSSGISTTGFREFTAANLRVPHPTFGHSVSDMATVLQYEFSDENGAIVDENGTAEGQADGDGMYARIRTTEHHHVRINNLGRKPVAIRAHGWHGGIRVILSSSGNRTVGGPQSIRNLVAFSKQEYFDRFGDGPVMGELHALSTADDIEPGDYARLTLGSYPNAQTQARGGTRIIQILSKVQTPNGPVFQYLDAGPNLQPLSKPSLTLANSTGDPKHTILATIGSVTAGGSFDLQAAVSTTQPSSNSMLWIPIGTSAPTTGVYPIAQRPAGGVVFGRVRNMAPGRLRSGWRVSTAGRATSGLAAPTALATTSIRAGTADLVFTPGETVYGTHVFLDTSTAASPSTNTNLAQRLPPGSRRTRLGGMSGNTLHRTWVQHYDQYGGVSGTDSTTFTTLSTASTGNLRVAPPLIGLWSHEGAT